MPLRNNVSIIREALNEREGRRRMASLICRKLEKASGHEMDTYDLIMGAIMMPPIELWDVMLEGARAYNAGKETALT
jgi:hypothetical protein